VVKIRGLSQILLVLDSGYATPVICTIYIHLNGGKIRGDISIVCGLSLSGPGCCRVYGMRKEQYET
jgi:hypothetical protein